MKKNNTIEATKKKQKYLAPVIEIMVVEMEYGIAKTSWATVKPGVSGGGVQEEWTDESDDSTELGW